MGARAPQAFTRHLKGACTDINGQDFGTWVEVCQVIGADTGPAACVQNPERSAGLGSTAMALAVHIGVGPAPVVSRRRTILNWVAGIGKAVVERAHHGSGGITGLSPGCQKLLRGLGARASHCNTGIKQQAANICSKHGLPSSSPP